MQITAQTLYHQKPDFLLNISMANRMAQYGSIFISLHAVVFESHKLPSSMYWHKNRIKCKMANEGHSRSHIFGSVER